PLALMQGSDLQLKVLVEAGKDHVGAIEFEPDWLPPGVSHEPAVRVNAGKTEATIKIQANDRAGPGVYQIAMNASTVGGDPFSGIGRVRVSSEFVELRVMAPYLSIELRR